VSLRTRAAVVLCSGLYRPDPCRRGKTEGGLVLCPCEPELPLCCAVDFIVLTFAAEARRREDWYCVLANQSCRCAVQWTLSSWPLPQRQDEGRRTGTVSLRTRAAVVLCSSCWAGPTTCTLKQNLFQKCGVKNENWAGAIWQSPTWDALRNVGKFSSKAFVVDVGF